MSTHATIAVQLKDETVKQIYVNFDGYLSYAGIILFEYYKSQEKVEELVSLGDLSVLGKVVTNGNSKDFTIAYHRDKQEDWRVVQPRTFIDYNDYQSFGDIESFNYIFIDNEWKVSYTDYSINKDILISLKTALGE